ncbi:MAG: hypothetical protein NW215_06350 [Hyphomicrobiales bacterium]|nr:hypothetical protein [Hyphomicrobiales bacterium]
MRISKFLCRHMAEPPAWIKTRAGERKLHILRARRIKAVKKPPAATISRLRRRPKKALKTNENCHLAGAPSRSAFGGMRDGFPATVQAFADISPL